MFRVKRIVAFTISFSFLFLIANNPRITSASSDEVSRWLAKLRDKDESVRRRAAYALKEIGPDTKAAVLELIKGLKDNDPYVRRYCAAALGELRLESDLAVPALMESLADTDQKVCAHAAVALAKIGSPAVPALVKALDRVDTPAASGRDIPLSDYAAFALAKIGAPAIPALIRSRGNRRVRITAYADYVIERNYESGKNVVPSLIQLLNENDRSILLSTIDLIRRIGPNAVAAAPQLVSIVKAGEPSLREKAATALGSIGAAALPEILPLLSDQNDKIRALGVTAIAELNSSGTSGEETKIESYLLLALEDRNIHVRKLAAEAFAESYSVGAQAILGLGRAVSDSNVNVRRAAIRSLIISLGPSEYRDRETQKSFLAIMPVFISALRDKDNEVRQTAVSLIGSLGVEAGPAVPHLIETIHDRVRNIRIEAIKALGLIGTTARPAIPALIRMLGAADAEHRSRIASTIGAIGAGDGATVAILVKLLNDPSPEARHAAVFGLEKLGPAAKPAIPALMNKLNTSKVKLRSEIVSAIGVIGADDDRTVAILTRLLKDPSCAVRQSAFQSLGRLGPQASAAIPQLIDALKRGRLIRIPLDFCSDDASTALAEIGPTSIAPLLEVLRDQDSDVRAEVIQIFSMMEPLPVEALLQALRSPYEDVRVAAIEVFGATVPNDKSIVTALIAGLKDSDGEARRSAATALGQYG
ncbi:MAG TPA: HEAT repeat domain-containing protein, partial [Blastocatellia bacterium]